MCPSTVKKLLLFLSGSIKVCRPFFCLHKYFRWLLSLYLAKGKSKKKELEAPKLNFNKGKLQIA